MIREEYNYQDVEDYFNKNNFLLIAGFPGDEDRSHYFYDIWSNQGKDLLLLKRLPNDMLEFRFISKGYTKQQCIDLCVQTAPLLNSISVGEKKVLLDMSSLDHVLIMFLTKQLVTCARPKAFFASYIRPDRYSNQSEDVGFSLSSRVSAVRAVPGFAKRESDTQTLCAFLGFEGVRLKGILEAVHGIENLIPVVAFPSGKPQWYNVTMWNSMDTLQSESNLTTLKCFSESVYEAFSILHKHIPPDSRLVLAPLGTRPHSMACALFACKHSNTRIIYDYVEESCHRAIGISNITIYHLTSFLDC